MCSASSLSPVACRACLVLIREAHRYNSSEDVVQITVLYCFGRRALSTTEYRLPLLQIKTRPTTSFPPRRTTLETSRPYPLKSLAIHTRDWAGHDVSVLEHRSPVGNSFNSALTLGGRGQMCKSANRSVVSAISMASDIHRERNLCAGVGETSVHN